MPLFVILLSLCCFYPNEPVTSGCVPHSSVLRPLLILLQIVDLPKALNARSFYYFRMA